MYRPRQYFLYNVSRSMTGSFMSGEERRALANQQYAAQFHPSVQNLVLNQYK